MSDDIFQLIKDESERQQNQLTLIASENYVSKNVLEANGSMLTNKYAEGYPGKRYYAGNLIMDQIEELAKLEAGKLFETDYGVNVQPYSGSPANLAAYSALLKPGDTILSMSLADGGHLTHGHSVSITSSIYNFIHYGVNKNTELIDYDQVLELAKEHKPKLIVCGATAYPALIDFTAFARIARQVGAWLMVDMAHFAGLVAGKVYPSPFGIADIITSSTHKTLRGPRGGLIFSRPEFTKAVDKAVFPGLQGGPHMQTIAAKTVAFKEAQEPSFKVYAKQVVTNAQTLAYRLQQHGVRLVSDGTDTHLLLLDLRSLKIGGKEAQLVLESAGLICNMNAIPNDPNPPNNPSGLRLGTSALTSRGMKVAEMEIIADLLIKTLSSLNSPTANLEQAEVREKVSLLARKFRIPLYY
jgi:glycine hydroxymethyltransferase